MQLTIAEKPSMAMDIAKAMGGSYSRKDGYLEFSNGDCVTWAVGHLLGQAYPEVYDSKYKAWNISDLPIIPSTWIMEPNPKTKPQLRIVGQLLKKASSVVHAGDSAREGQLIIDEILDYFKFSGSVKRLWLQESNTAAIKKALATMKSNKTYEPIYVSGLCRQRADWIIGLSGTRLYTIEWQRINGGREVLHVGRVQTPTLGFVVERDLTIENFVPKDYFVLKVDVKHKNGNFDARWDPPKGAAYLDESGRVIDKKVAEAVALKVKSKVGSIHELETQDKRQLQPLTFSLGDLQKACYKRFGLNPTETLKIAQALYETHKLTSYPRTDFSHLPEDEHGLSQGFVEAAKSNLGVAWDFPGTPDYSIKSHAFNSSKIGDHHGIRPTAVRGVNMSALSKMEMAVYKMIVRQFLAQFYSPYEYKSTSVTVLCEQEQFKATGTQPVKMGWKVLFSADDQDDKEPKLPQMAKQDPAKIEKADVESKQTLPPPRLNAATLLDLMENAWKYVTDQKVKSFVRDAGIGTPATRASIIKNLIDRGYMEELGTGKSKYYCSTAKGRMLYLAVPEKLRKPDLTAYFEQILKDIEAGTSTQVLFETRVKQFVDRLIADVKAGSLAAEMIKNKVLVDKIQSGDSSMGGKVKKGARTATSRVLGSEAPKRAGSKAKGKQCSCGSQMMLRKGKNGDFWGCTTYPKCSNTEQADKAPVKATKKSPVKSGSKPKQVQTAKEGSFL